MSDLSGLCFLSTDCSFRFSDNRLIVTFQLRFVSLKDSHLCQLKSETDFIFSDLNPFYCCPIPLANSGMVNYNEMICHKQNQGPYAEGQEVIIRGQRSDYVSKLT